MEGIILILVLVLALFTGIPVAFGIVLTVLLGYSTFMSTPLMNVGQAMVTNVNSFALMAVFFYIMAGQFLSHGRIAQEIVNICQSIVGRMRGGIAITAVLACALFGAVSGSTSATLVAIGGLMFPVMMKAGYDRVFSLSVILGASTLGIVIPPSIPEVLYGFLTGVSIFKLFVSGLIPAAIIIGIYVIYIRFKCKDIPVDENVEVGPKALLKAMKSGIWALFFPVIIFGGIITGIYTSNEAAVLAASYAFIVELFIYRSINLKEAGQYMLDAVVTTGAVLILVAGASTFAEAITYLQVPAMLAEFFAANVSGKWGFLGIITIILLIAGMLVDNNSAILILTPVLFPMLATYGVDPVHFGFIMNLNLGIGYLSPPFAASLFMAVNLFDTPYTKVLRAVVTPIIILLIALLLSTFIPQLVLFLPNLITA